MTGGSRSFPLENWQSNFGEAAGPEGTLMRGMQDSLSNRIWQGAMWVLFMGSLFMGFGLATRNPMLGPRGPGITPMFVGVSLMSVAVLAPLTLAEWPVRLRQVWLRGAGDRIALWSMLERALLEQTLIVAGLAAAILPVIACFAGFGLLCRELARRQFRAVDWCAVRPTRLRDSRRLLGGRR